MQKDELQCKGLGVVKRGEIRGGMGRMKEGDELYLLGARRPPFSGENPPPVGVAYLRFWQNVKLLYECFNTMK